MESVETQSQCKVGRRYAKCKAVLLFLCTFFISSPIVFDKQCPFFARTAIVLPCFPKTPCKPETISEFRHAWRIQRYAQERRRVLIYCEPLYFCASHKGMICVSVGGGDGVCGFWNLILYFGNANQI